MRMRASSASLSTSASAGESALLSVSLPAECLPSACLLSSDCLSGCPCVRPARLWRAVRVSVRLLAVCVLSECERERERERETKMLNSEENEQGRIRAGEQKSHTKNDEHDEANDERQRRRV